MLRINAHSNHTHFNDLTAAEKCGLSALYPESLLVYATAERCGDPQTAWHICLNESIEAVLLR